MMKHFKYFLMALLFITGFISNVYATGDDRDIYDDGYNRVASDGSVIHRTRMSTTGETVDYGYDTYTTTSFTLDGGHIFQLPTAQSGVRVTFILDKAIQCDLNPVSGAIFSGHTTIGGQSLVINPTTGNSVTLHAVNDTTWAVLSKIGGLFHGE
jgi:hypothetical protein